jgi:hypothetical protein
MSRLPRIALATAILAGVLVTTAAAQRGLLPEGVVARVGEERVPEREFRHWLRASVRGQSVPVDPPGFERCMAAEQERIEVPSSTRELRQRCRRRHEALRDSTMLFLLTRVWVRQEAEARGLSVSRQRIRRAFERQRRAAFPRKRDFREFLRMSGLTKADLLDRVELDILQQRLVRSATGDIPEVTRQDVDRYYARHRQQFRGQPPARARRTIRVQLKATRQQRALGRFLTEFRSGYRAITVCERGYVIPECSNGR